MLLRVSDAKECKADDNDTNGDHSNDIQKESASSTADYSSACLKGSYTSAKTAGHGAQAAQ